MGSEMCIRDRHCPVYKMIVAKQLIGALRLRAVAATIPAMPVIVS